MADKSKTIIVKKIKKGHAAAHGGSWKVAYADFVTAMMAFFLLMWLLAMVSPEKRAAVSEYFRNFSIFEKSGQSFMMGQTQVLEKQGGDIKTIPAKEIGKGAGGEISAENMKEKLKKAVEEKLRGLKEQVMIDTFEGGVRIQLIDTEGSSMFASGSAQPTDRARQLLKLIAENIKDTPNKIAVEGHTDAAPLKKGQTTNWELSTGRASSARKELESGGIVQDRIARVVGYADQDLLIKDKPEDARNRRISIILLQQKLQKPAEPAAAEIKEELKAPRIEQPPVVQPPVQPPAAQPAPKPELKPVPQFRPIQVQPPIEQSKKSGVEKPISKMEQKKEAIKPDVGRAQKQSLEKPIPKIEQKSAPVEQVKKPSEARQEKKKSVIDPIGSKKPIDINKPFINPDMGK